MPDAPTRRRTAFIGAGAALLSAPLAAALVAAVYRFPVPFGGYVSGADAADAAIAAVFYLLMGGLLVLSLLGGFAGVALAGRARAPRAAIWLAITAGFAVAVLGAVVLALLEYVIGPW